MPINHKFGARRLRQNCMNYCVSLTLTLLAGCGGGGGLLGNNPGSGGNTSPTARTAGTASFHVDVPTGKVTITSMQGGKAAGRAVFAGSAVSLNSSDLLDLVGNPAVKVLNVSITNHQGAPIGLDSNGNANGLTVLFSAISNVSNLTSDLRTKVNVGTVAGTGTYASADGAALSTPLEFPQGTASDGAGSIYFTTKGDNRVRKLNQGYVSSVAGGGSSYGAGIGATAAFNQPFGIAYNPTDGSLAVAEYGGDRIRRVTPQGRVSLIAGTGTAGYADGSGTTATFTSPAGVAIDSLGNIYVAEANNIRKITFVGGDPTNAANYTVSTLAGSSTAGTADGIGAAASFGLVFGVTVDQQGTAYATDYTYSRIRRVDSSGDVTTIAGTSAGSGDGSGATCKFANPRGIAYTQGALVISDFYNNRIRLLVPQPGANPANPNSWRSGTLAGAGALTGAAAAGFADGTGDVAQFDTPELLCADPAGNITIADFLNNRLRSLQLPANFNQIGASNGSAPAEPVVLSNPDGTIPGDTSHASGFSYIQYPGSAAAGAASAAKTWSFQVPPGATAFEFTVTVEAAIPYPAVMEYGTGVGSSDLTVRTYAGTGVAGDRDGPEAIAQFNLPYGVVEDRAGDLFVADSHNGAVRRIAANGLVSTIIGVPGIGMGTALDGYGNVAQAGLVNGVAVTADGSAVYFCDSSNGSVRRSALVGNNPADPASWLTSTIAGAEAISTMVMDGSGTIATFAEPHGICIDGNGNLFVTEFSGNRIRALQPSGGDLSLASNWQVSEVAGDATTAFPSTGFVDNTTGSAARFNGPTDVLALADGSVVLSDSSNVRIRRVTLGIVAASDRVTTLAGNGTLGYLDGPAAGAEFKSPDGLAGDAAGNVYVVDRNANVVRVITRGGTVATVAGGAPGYVNGSGVTAHFVAPAALAVGPDGSLFVADYGNSVIRLIQRNITSGSQ